MLLVGLAALAAAAATQTRSEAPPPVIAEERPLTCATPDVHPRIAVSVTPASQIVDVRVFFRTVDPAPARPTRPPSDTALPTAPSGGRDQLARLDGQSSQREAFPGDGAPSTPLPPSAPDGAGWYRVRLSQEGEAWKGALPRPTGRLKRFAYYVEVFDASARVTRGEERSVRVARKDSPCPAEETGAVATAEAVMVQAPSIDTAAVPNGFSTKGTRSSGASKVGVTNMGARTSLLVSLGVGAAAGAVALTTYKPEEPQSDVELLGSEPGAGSVISLSSPRLAIRLRLESPVDVGPGSVFVGLRRGFGLTCVSLRTPHTGFRAHAPAEVTVDQVDFVGCAAPFQVDSARVDVRGPEGRPEFGRQLPLVFNFVP
jgi:hypothetical protein